MNYLFEVLIIFLISFLYLILNIENEKLNFNKIKISNSIEINKINLGKFNQVNNKIILDDIFIDTIKIKKNQSIKNKQNKKNDSYYINKTFNYLYLLEYFDITNIKINNIIYDNQIIIYNLIKNKNNITLNFANNQKITIEILNKEKTKFLVKYKNLTFKIDLITNNLINCDFFINNKNILNFEVIISEKFLKIINVEFEREVLNNIFFQQEIKFKNILNNIFISNYNKWDNENFILDNEKLYLNLPYFDINKNIKMQNIDSNFNFSKNKININIENFILDNLLNGNLKIDIKNYNKFIFKFNSKKTILNFKIILNKNSYLIKTNKIIYNNVIYDNINLNLNKNFKNIDNKYFKYNNNFIFIKEDLLNFISKNKDIENIINKIKILLKINKDKEIKIKYLSKPFILKILENNYEISYKNKQINVKINEVPLTNDIKFKNIKLILKYNNNKLNIIKLKLKIYYKDKFMYEILNFDKGFIDFDNNIVITGINNSFDFKYKDKEILIQEIKNKKILIDNFLGNIVLDKFILNYKNNKLNLNININQMNIKIPNNLNHYNLNHFNKKDKEDNNIQYDIKIVSNNINKIEYNNNIINSKSFLFNYTNQNNKSNSKSNFNILNGKFYYKNKLYNILPSSLNIINGNKIINTNIEYKDKNIKVLINVIGNVENDKIFINMNSIPYHSNLEIISYLFMDNKLNDNTNQESFDSKILKTGTEFFANKFNLPIDSISIQNNKENNEKEFIFTKKINNNVKINLIKNKEEDNLEVIYNLKNNILLKSYKKEKSNGFFIEYQNKY
jgi:hypothetical protein